MINNSSLKKWDRLSKKQLDNQFVQKIMNGLNCSPFESSAILETVHEVYSTYFQTSGKMKLGQVIFQVASIDMAVNEKIEEGKQTTVVLTLDAGIEDLKIRKNKGVIGLRRHRIQRVCEEAFQQDGLLTVEDLAIRIFNCGERTISRDLKYFREQNITLPLRSSIKDMGRSISHRSLIIEEWLKGKEYSDITRITNHSIPSIQNYINKFKRVIALSEENFDVNTIGFLVKLSPRLVEEYFNLYKDLDIVPSRKEEIKFFFTQQEANKNKPKAKQIHA